MKVNQICTFQLELNEYERDWLRAVMQNPLFGETPDEEDASNREMRLRFFTALSGLPE